MRWTLPLIVIAVVYDGTLLARGHMSHIRVDTVTVFYTGPVQDYVALSNRCMLGPNERDDDYDHWMACRICQKNSLNLAEVRFMCLCRMSFEKPGLWHQNIVCDGDSRTFVALCEDETCSFVPFTKRKVA